MGEAQPEQSPAGAEISVVAGTAENQIVPPESAGVKNFAQDMGIMDVGIVKQPAVLTQLEQGKFEETERARKAKGPEGTESAVCTKTNNAASIWTESTESASGP